MARPKSTMAPLVNAEVALDPGSLNTLTGEDVVVSVPGLRVGFPVHIWCEDASLEAGLGVTNAFASDKDELTVRFFNFSSGTINGAERTWSVVQR